LAGKNIGALERKLESPFSEMKKNEKEASWCRNEKNSRANTCGSPLQKRINYYLDRRGKIFSEAHPSSQYFCPKLGLAALGRQRERGKKRAILTIRKNGGARS